MQSLILTGNEQDRNEYISRYLNDKGIKNYNLIVYDKRIKIQDVREIKKSISFKHDEITLFIFSSDITIDAQNSLLKILEEPPANVFFMFSLPTKDILIPTIVSRSFIIPLQESGSTKAFLQSEMYPVLEKHISEMLVNANNRLLLLHTSLLLSEKIESSKDPKIIELFIFTLITFLKKNITGSDDKSKIRLQSLYKIADLLYYYNKYINSNNLNKRIVLDKILLEAFNI